MRKALVIAPGSIGDLGDVVKIARKEGKKALGREKVRVLPELTRDSEGNFIVLVEAYGSKSASAGVAEDCDDGSDPAYRSAGVAEPGAKE